jgi:photosystem II stability/assembly factor-like uncharacterized protein
MSGGNIPNLVVDPGQTAYAATPLRVGKPGGTPGDVRSILKSADFGVTWTPADGDLPAPVSGTFVADPITPGVLYAWTSLGLYKTLDGGTHWSKLPLNPPGVAFAGEIAIAPTNPNRIYVATTGNYVQRSTDGGQTWNQSSVGLFGPPGSDPADVSVIAVSPTNELVAYTATYRGYLFRTMDGGDHWSPIGDTSHIWAPTQLYVAPSDSNVLYLRQDENAFPGSGGTIVKSIDAGTTWTDAGRPDGTPGDAIQLQILPTDPNTVYATTSAGLYETTTGGGVWKSVFAPNNGGSYLLSVALNPGKSILYVGSQYSGVYRSTDGGKTWAQANNGVFNVEDAGLDVCSSDPTRVYAAANGGIPIATTDGGATWTQIGAAQTSSEIVIALACNPSNASRLLVGTQNYAGPHYNHGVGNIWVSNDSGLTFNAASVSLFDQYWSLYPGWFGFNPKNPSLVNASLQDFQYGFLYSADGGSSWTQPYPSYIYPGEYAYHPTLANIVFTSANQYWSSQSPWDHLYIAYSADFGVNWQGYQVPAEGSVPAEGYFANTVALDQGDPTVLYTAGIIDNEGTRGVYKFKVAYTGDQVTSVTRVPGTFNTGLTSPDVNQLLYNAATGYLYAATGSGVFRSNDGAATWTALNGDLPHLEVTRISISPDGLHLYAGTNGGIYELDVP